MSHPLRSTTAAVVVPDEQTWTLRGADPAGEGVHPIFTPATAHHLLTPVRLPDALVEPYEDLLAQVGEAVEPDIRPLEWPGERRTRTLAAGQHGGSSMAAQEHEHEEDGDPMAIEGEPSADGLVMEPIELRVGPLCSPFPGGLVVEVELDGDVVAAARVKPTLTPQSSGPGTPASPDALSSTAWDVAIARAGEGGSPGSRRRQEVIGLELERALSHLAWLRSLGRLLDWRSLIDACQMGVSALADARRARAGSDLPAVRDALERSRRPVVAVRELVESRRLRLRTEGKGVVDPGDAGRHGLTGPVARGCGIPDDARAADGVYLQLGFEPVVEPAGDAHARALVRAREAGASLDLVEAAASRELDPPAGGQEAAGAERPVEGPRGPLRASRSGGAWAFEAKGSEAVREAAATAMVGLEWAAALVALASFDLSPWRVNG